MTKLHDIPATLRALRAQLDLTQEQLADRLGVAFATVNRWEGGAAKPQKAAQETIAALAVEAGLDMEAVAAEPVDSAASVTRRRRGRSASPPSTKTMEQMLWGARLFHPRRTGSGQVQRLPVAAPLSKTAVGCFR